MNPRLLPAILCVWMLNGLDVASADMHLPPSVASLVQSSDVIAVVRVAAFTLDSSADKPDYFDPILVHSATYRLTSIYQLKGTAPDELDVHIGPLYSFPYLNNLPTPKAGDTLLVFLTQGPTGYLPDSIATPFYPVRLPSGFQPDGNDPLHSVYQVLCASLSDASLLPLMTSALESAVDPDVVLAMAKHVDDPDPYIRDRALACMAANSQLAAIPLIAQFADETLVDGEIEFSVLRLGSYTSKEAVPYLNSLLWNSLGCVRHSAMQALTNTADNSSAPYLILALRDPAPNLTNAGFARFLLAKNILKSRFPYEDYASLAAHFQSDVQVIDAWWDDELSGKHLDQTDPAAVQAQASEASEVVPATVENINPLLFKPYPSLRERAIAALRTKADESSIPYLLVALQDPDQTVSYGAYSVLSRLFNYPNLLLTQSDFESNQDAATKPFYDWWSAELLGKHSKVKPFIVYDPPVHHEGEIIMR